MASYIPKTLKITKSGNTYTLAQGIPYGVCSTAASTEAKTVDTDIFPGLVAGVTVNVKFTNGNTHASPTLNVNSTGAKPIYKYGTNVAGTDFSWTENAVYSLTYDGTGWLILNYIPKNDTYLLEIDCGTITPSSGTAFTKTVSDAAITADMIVVEHTVGNDTYVINDMDYETANGSITISGDLYNATTLIVYLMKKHS